MRRKRIKKMTLAINRDSLICLIKFGFKCFGYVQDINLKYKQQGGLKLDKE